MEKALVPTSPSVPTGWKGLVLRNGLEKMSGSQGSRRWVVGKVQEAVSAACDPRQRQAPLTRRPFAPLMPGGPRDPGGPCRGRKSLEKSPFRA